MYDKLLCKAGLNVDFFMNLKEDGTLHKNCGWKLEREIADDPLSERLTLLDQSAGTRFLGKSIIQISIKNHF